MSRTIIKIPAAPIRNHVAKDMIANGNGKSQVFKDRRDKRNKNPKHSTWNWED